LRLFVTGAESFIGRALVSRCHKSNLDLTGVDIAASLGPATHRADIRDPAIGDLIPEGATVIHLAAISRDPDCRADPRAAFDVNVTGTMNLASAAEKKRARQFIFASSEWVYGDVHNNELQVEEQPIDITKIKSEYALTKIVAEQCLRINFRLPAITILRFGIVYGPRSSNWSAVESLFNAVRTQDEVKVGAVASARRFIHVQDTVSGILASCNRTGFEIFNIAGDGPITLGQVIVISARMLGRSPEIVESNPLQPSIRNPVNCKAKTHLRWSPTIDLEAGLRTIADFLESQPGGTAR
jgi:nucleoside-diphosphate-sugar epimerase